MAREPGYAETLSAPKVEIVEAGPNDIETVRAVEFAAFGKNYVRSVHRQILDKHWNRPRIGRGYLVKDGKASVGYVLLKFKRFDQAEIDGEILSAWDNPSLGRNVMRDHHGFEGDVDIFAIGVVPERQHQGIAKSMLEQVRDDLFVRDKGKKVITSVARVNNASVALLMKIFGMSPLAIQGASKLEDTFMGATGSEETNFLLASPVPPLAKLPEKMSDVPVWKIGTPDPEGNSFLLSMPIGEQKELSPLVVELLERVMAVGEVPIPGKDFGMRRICTAEELRIAGLDVPGGRYLYFSRNPNLTAEQGVKIYARLYADLVNPEPVSRIIR